MRHTAHLEEAIIPNLMVIIYDIGPDDKLTMISAIYPDPYGGYDEQDCGITKPANVISTSYGMNEAEVSPAYAIRQCNEYGKLGLAGVTVLYSSGDDGVAGNGDICLDSDGALLPFLVIVLQ